MTNQNLTLKVEKLVYLIPHIYANFRLGESVSDMSEAYGFSVEIIEAAIRLGTFTRFHSGAYNLHNTAAIMAEEKARQESELTPVNSNPQVKEQQPQNN